MTRVKRLTLDDIHVGILRHRRAGPVSLTPLVGTLAKRAKLYRHARELVMAGLLRNLGRDRWETTDAGRRTIEESESFGPAWNPLDILYSPLRDLSPRYRAFVRLEILGSLSRERELRESHHANFVLLGDTLSFKSSSAHVTSYALGEDPTRSVFLTPSESGKSVSLRKTYAGRTASLRAALGRRFVAFDEFDKASPATRKEILVYTAGRLEFPIENEVFRVRPVPLLIMNPKKGKTLAERTGLSRAELRRSIVFAVTAEDVSEDMRLRGEAILERAKKAGVVPLPPPAGVTVRAEDVAVPLRPCLTPEGVALVDYEMAAMLCEAMAAFAETGYVELVLRDLLTIYETVGWADPSWRIRLADPMAVPATAPTQAGATTTPSLRDRTLAILEDQELVVPADLDHHARLRRIDALLRAEHLDAQVAVDRLDALRSWRKVGYPFSVFVVLYPKWKETGDAERFSKAVREIVERFRSLLAFEAAKKEHEAFLAEVGGTWEDVKYGFRFKDELRTYGVTPMEGLAAFLRIVRELQDQGLDPKEAVPALVRLYRQYASLAEAVKATDADLRASHARLGETNDKAREAFLRQEQEERRWSQGETAHAEVVRKREAKTKELDEGIAWRTETLAKKDAALSAADARLARPDRVMVVGEAVIQAAETKNAKGLFDLAQTLTEMRGQPMAVFVVFDLLELFQRQVKEFVGYMDRVPDFVAKVEAAMEEKDRTIERLTAELGRIKEPVKEEGTV